MAAVILNILLAGMHIVGALRLKAPLEEAGPDLAGLWFQRRTIMGMGVLGNRFFDIVKGPEGFRAFPITACTPDGSWTDFMGLGSMSCDEVIQITITSVNSSAGTGYVATKTVKDRSVVANLIGDDQTELKWSDGTVWELHTEAVTLLDDWDDEECRALSGAASSDPLSYDVYGGTSASLEFKNVPGVTIDLFACVQNDWLYKHQARFECILRKASESKEKDNSKKKEMVAKALEKLREVMPKDENSICVPAVCIGISVTKFPIPSPVPTISLFVSWPIDQDQCNGANIRDAISEVEQEASSEATAMQELKKSAFNGMHGSSISVFPVPNVAYFAMGTVHASGVFGGGIDTEQLLQEGRKAATEIEGLIKQAIEQCPTIASRFEGHSMSDDVRGALAQSQTQGETLRIVAKSFPELASVSTSKGTHLGFGAGTYGQIGWLGATAGVFGGGSFQSSTLGKSYQGCSKWAQVIKVWYNSPLSELDPAQMATLAKPPPREHAEASMKMKELAEHSIELKEIGKDAEALVGKKEKMD